MKQPKEIFSSENPKTIDMKALYCKSLSCLQHFIIDEVQTNRPLLVCDLLFKL